MCAYPQSMGGKGLILSTLGLHTPRTIDEDRRNRVQESEDEDGEYVKMLDRHGYTPGDFSKLKSYLILPDSLTKSIKSAVERKRYTDNKAKEIKKTAKNKLNRAVVSFLLEEYDMHKSYSETYRDYLSSLKSCSATGLRLDDEFVREEPNRDIYRACINDGFYSEDDDKVYIYVDNIHIREIDSNVSDRTKVVVVLTSFPEDVLAKTIKDALEKKGYEVEVRIMDISCFCVPESEKSKNNKKSN